MCGVKKHAESYKRGRPRNLIEIEAEERKIPESMKFLQQSEGGVVLPGEEHEEHEKSIFQGEG